MKPIKRVMWKLKETKSCTPRQKNKAGGGAKLPTEYQAECMVIAKHEEPRG